MGTGVTCCMNRSISIDGEAYMVMNPLYSGMKRILIIHFGVHVLTYLSKLMIDDLVEVKSVSIAGLSI
jgi:hypothetical protein